MSPLPTSTSSSYFQTSRLIPSCLHQAVYYGELGLGTPAQMVKVMFATGSADSWVPANDCRSFGCSFHSLYNRSASQSYKEWTSTPFNLTVSLLADFTFVWDCWIDVCGGDSIRLGRLAVERAATCCMWAELRSAARPLVKSVTPIASLTRNIG